MKLHRNVFFLENGWRNVGGVMKSFFCNHKKILFEHRLDNLGGSLSARDYLLEVTF